MLIARFRNDFAKDGLVQLLKTTIFTTVANPFGEANSST
jgi:hypothetical protein